MRIAILFSLLLALPMTSIATTINIPADQPTIQAGINAAVNGDTILVAPGTYVENIQFLGKAITVQSSAGATLTVIDGGQNGTVVRFLANEVETSVLDGFTITNGTGTPWVHGVFSSVCGGGIFCDMSSPTIRNNIIDDNEAGSGGGICCWWYSSPCIERNIIRQNQAFHGGGIQLLKQCRPNISDNLIYENTASGGGGGIQCQEGGTFPLIINNTICDNYAGQRGGAIKFYGCRGSSNPKVVNCILYNNFAYIEGSEISVVNLTTVEMDYSVLHRGTASIHTDLSSSVDLGTNIIETDPIFITGGASYHLATTSPCINRGSNDDISSLDIDGNSRLFMGTVDIGADEYVDEHLFEADTFSVAVTGGTVNFTLNGGLANANRTYIIFGGTSGTLPGYNLPGNLAILPINWDTYTDYVLANLNGPIFSNFYQSLNGSGSGSAQLNMPQLDPSQIGLIMYYAYALNNPYNFASNVIQIEVVP